MSVTASAPLFANAPLEFRLLAASCAWPRTDERRAIVASLANGSVDWDRFLRLVRRHRVGGLVADGLKSCADVPTDIRTALHSELTRTAVANLRAVALQTVLVDALQAAGVEVAVLKGTPLCVMAFCDVRLRSSKDIDLLIREADVDGAEAVLLAHGFVRGGEGRELSPKQRSLWMRYRKHFEYSRADGTQVELHWRCSDNRWMDGPGDPLAELERVTVAEGRTLPSLARRLLLLDLCVHGAGHAWFRLKWLADVQALLSREGAVGELLRDAKGAGLERPVIQALLLCDGLFGGDVAARAPQQTALVHWLARVGRDALLQEDVTAHTGEAAFVPKGLALSKLMLRRGWRYRAEELRVAMASPADWKVMPLPDGLRFAYPLLRLPLWMKRRWFAGGSR